MNNREKRKWSVCIGSACARMEVGTQLAGGVGCVQERGYANDAQEGLRDFRCRWIVERMEQRE